MSCLERRPRSQRCRCARGRTAPTRPRSTWRPRLAAVELSSERSRPKPPRRSGTNRSSAIQPLSVRRRLHRHAASTGRCSARCAGRARTKRRPRPASVSRASSSTTHSSSATTSKPTACGIASAMRTSRLRRATSPRRRPFRPARSRPPRQTVHRLAEQRLASSAPLSAQARPSTAAAARGRSYALRQRYP